MMEDDGEIEYLDEDENLVQQYVQNLQSLPVIEYVRSVDDIQNQIDPLLVERKIVESKRKHRSDEDSDYVPGEDLPQRKKRKLPTKRTQYTLKPVASKSMYYVNHNTAHTNKTYVEKLKNLPNLTVKKQDVARKYERRFLIKEKRPGPPQKKPTPLYSIVERKKLDIKIPDYDDPLCLPVKAIKKDDNDLRRLRNWNNLCLDQFKKCDGSLRVDKGTVVSSTKTIVLRNVKNKTTGKIDTTIWGKSTTENENGEKKTETFSSILPKYREKKMLGSYQLLPGHPKYNKHVCEAILTKEDQKDGDILVVYKPKEAVSAVYRMLGGQNSEDMEYEEDETKEKRVLKEVACCKVCAPCFQASWRGVRRKTDQDGVKCHMCSRNFVSVYNLLTHLKTNHTPQDVRKNRGIISRTLASAWKSSNVKWVITWRADRLCKTET
ncbi:uncharacterized protein LOC126377361 isoform X2 [Pectinophora gossypiella]|uniref:uncharacterized protein LOC126377361 isoform X2 n=1 Tax=Pectinophora gossypiella TaxID=13191 RepID=UPI00214E7A29|nr:uncharacterized protein LOC126377361 isoform X2 [Pectinophora gossypiella]